MSALTTELAQWFGGRPKWLQEAARRLLQSGAITTHDVEELTVLCKREAGIQVAGFETLNALPVNKDAFQEGQRKVNVRLRAISDVQGINALAPREPLTFQDEPLTIVYGINGAGKSGYTRLLKHCCGARGQGTLHRNVFQTTSHPQKCKISYIQDGTEKDLDWMPAVGVHPDLRHFCLYDTDAAQVYVNSENEVTYEPALLACFRVLVEVCEAINSALDGEVKGKPSRKPILPTEHSTTVSGIWYEKLNVKTKAQEVQDICNWTMENEELLATVNDRLKEANPAERAKTLRKTKGHVLALKQLLENEEMALSDDSFLALSLVRDKAKATRQAADVDAKKVFEGAPLDGVASESWKLLWEQARSFSEGLAYPDASFPNVSEGANCVLCQQPLNVAARERLQAFETFVKGALESNAKEVENDLQELIERIEATVLEDRLEEKLDLCGVTDEATRTQVKKHAGALTARKTGFITGVSKYELKPLPDKAAIELLAILETTLEASATTFEEDAKTDTRPELQKQVKEFNGKKWLSEQKKAIEDEITRLKDVALLKEGQKLTNTTALSSKKSDLAENLITKAFIDRFEKELEALGASRIQVTIEKTRGTKGQVWHQLKLKGNQSGAKAIDVLSEGEFRIVSIAAFLADVDVSEGATPFIFDDPISSLDQDFEEATAERLVKLCRKRQVIVFTHRLSLLAMLENSAEKAGVDVRVVSLQREAWGTGQPGGPPMPAQKPKAALNELSNSRLSRAKKVWKDEGSAAYAVEAKALCSDVRITLERLIELELLADVIQRFRRPINTMGKIGKLARINKDDCEFLDAMMTKYSRYEHAQPKEAPVQLPEPDEIENDLGKLKTWQTEFAGRAIP